MRSVHSHRAMICLSDSRRSSSLCSMYCGSLTLAQTCSYCLCLTFIRETKPCPLDNLYTAAAFPSESPRTWLSCFVSLAGLRTTDSDPESLSWLQALPSSHALCFYPDIPWQWRRKHHKQHWCLGNWPYMAWKELRKASVWKRLYGLSSSLLLVIIEIMWAYAKRQQDRACCVMLQKGQAINITERN